MSLPRQESKKLKLLQTKKGRESYGQFLVSGVRLLEEAHRFKVRPVSVYLCEHEADDRGRSLVGRFDAQGIPVLTISSRELSAIADTVTPQGVAALFSIPDTTLSEQNLRNIRRILICENIADPGNVGTLVRSALAFSFKAVVACGTTAELWSPKVVRASAGAIFGVNAMCAETDQLINGLISMRIPIIASDVRGNDATHVRLPDSRQRGFALAVGSEATGLSVEMLAGASLKIRINQSREVESLNAAVAGSILMCKLYERDNAV